ncbi:MAG: hypothetical protein GY722_14965 [bacterium]|nr:hypothetical protein [bacterium]
MPRDEEETHEVVPAEDPTASNELLALLAINVFFIADALETTVEIQSQLLHETWDAAGYVLEDPATGAGGYFRDL